MFSHAQLWKCPLCEQQIAYVYRAAHNCSCRVCGETVNGTTTHDCTPEAQAEREAEKAQAELRDDNVAALLHEWGIDATKGLPEDQQDAHVTVTAQRAFADWLREHGR